MTTCDSFAKILKAKRDTNPGVCFATRMRNDIEVEVMGRTTHSPTVLLMAFSYEDLDSKGNALCLGEFVFKQNEVRPFLNALSNHGIRVTSIHNHWLFENPRLIYVHWEAIMKPLEFARISSRAMDIAMGKKVTKKGGRL
ncbi:MAG: DUF1259 domain-containing protein [Deltaproteobacteria bacterium]